MGVGAQEEAAVRQRRGGLRRERSGAHHGRHRGSHRVHRRRSPRRSVQRRDCDGDADAVSRVSDHRHDVPVVRVVRLQLRRPAADRRRSELHRRARRGHDHHLRRDRGRLCHARGRLHPQAEDHAPTVEQRHSLRARLHQRLRGRHRTLLRGHHRRHRRGHLLRHEPRAAPRASGRRGGRHPGASLRRRVGRARVCAFRPLERLRAQVRGHSPRRPGHDDAVRIVHGM